MRCFVGLYGWCYNERPVSRPRGSVDSVGHRVPCHRWRVWKSQASAVELKRLQKMRSGTDLGPRNAWMGLEWWGSCSFLGLLFCFGACRFCSLIHSTGAFRSVRSSQSCRTPWPPPSTRRRARPGAPLWRSGRSTRSRRRCCRRSYGASWNWMWLGLTGEKTHLEQNHGKKNGRNMFLFLVWVFFG